jgi:uncharacterized protein YndB with AHSA1/START domain
MPQDWIEREVLIEASRERVWTVLTDARQVAGWFGEFAEIDLRPGGRAAFGWAPGSVYAAVIQRVEQPSAFAYRLARVPGAEPGEGNSTMIEFTLTEVFAGTLVRLVETGFASLHATEQEQDKAVQENTDRWIAEFAELKDYAERPPS